MGASPGRWHRGFVSFSRWDGAGEARDEPGRGKRGLETSPCARGELWGCAPAPASPAETAADTFGELQQAVPGFDLFFNFIYFLLFSGSQDGAGSREGRIGALQRWEGGMRTGHAERSPAAEAHTRSAPWHAGDPRPAQAGMRCRARPQHGPSLGNKRPELSRAGGNPLSTTAGATPARALHPQHLLSLCHLLGLERNLNLAFDTFLKP